MHNYEVFLKGDIEKIIKVGFSWPAFFFSWLWAASKGLVFVAILGYVVFVTLHYVIHTSFMHFYPVDSLLGWSITHLPALFSNLCHFTWQVIFGLLFGKYGNQWHKNKLLRQKYVLIETIQAKNFKMAKRLYRLSNDVSEVP